jgi:ABC-type antimicrobial peptide transport system permease subunit
MRSGLKLVVLGLAVGLAGAAGTARAIQSLLTNVQPLNPAVYAAVAAFFGLVGVAACLAPSIRAARIDPVTALAAGKGARRR